MAMRIVVLAQPGPLTCIAYNAVAAEFPIAATILEERVPRAQLLRRRVKKLGVARAFGQVLFRAGIAPALSWSARTRVAAIKREFALDESPIPADTIVRVSSVNAPECIAALQQLRPDVVIVAGTRILSAATLGAVRATFVNTHAGITPLYRGVHGGYWALSEDRRDACGVTVHLVDTGVDTGGILRQGLIAPTAHDNFTTYPWLQTAVGVQLLRDVLRDLAAGKVQTQPPPPGPSRLWTHPTAWQYLWNRWRAGVK